MCVYIINIGGIDGVVVVWANFNQGSILQVLGSHAKLLVSHRSSENFKFILHKRFLILFKF